MKDKNGSELGVDQINLAAFLLSCNLPILHIEASGRFGIFYFDADQARPLIDQYLSGEARTEPRKFASSVRTLRAKVDDLIAGKENTGSTAGSPS